MKCRHCQTDIVADAEGDWLHISTMADRPCDNPERPTEADEDVLTWLREVAERWQPAGVRWPRPAPEGVAEFWLECPLCYACDGTDLDVPHEGHPPKIRFRAVLDDGTALTVTRDLTGRTLEAS